MKLHYLSLTDTRRITISMPRRLCWLLPQPKRRVRCHRCCCC